MQLMYLMRLFRWGWMNLTVLEKSAKCSRYKMDLIPSLAHYPNCRYALSVDHRIKVQKICDYLQEFHRYKDLMHKFPSPDNLFDKVWNVKEKVLRNTDIDRFKPVWEIIQCNKEEEGLNFMRRNEYWKVCFLHFYMPMVMDPEHRLEHIKSRIQQFTAQSPYTVDDDIDDYIGEVHDTLLNLYGEYFNQVQEPDCTSWSKISMGKFIGRDILHELYTHTKYPYRQRPQTELDHYLEEARRATGESGVLQWWKEHSLTYPTLGRMARDILALPCSTDTDSKAATRTARFVMGESGSTSRVQILVCMQDWLTPAGTTSVESTDDREN